MRPAALLLAFALIPQGDRLDAYLREHGIRHFRAVELYGDHVPPSTLWPHILPALRVAEWLRARVGPLRVTSGYRTRAHNAEVGGAPHSKHLSFRALDIATDHPAQLARLLRRHPATKGVGIYPTHLHLDTRAQAARWRAR